MSSLYLVHHGILGQKWGVRRWQYADGSLTPAGKKRYYGESGYSVKKTVGELNEQHRQNIAKIQSSRKQEKTKQKEIAKQDMLYKNILADKQKYERNKEIAKKVLIATGAVAVTAAVAYGIYKLKKGNGASDVIDKLGVGDTSNIFGKVNGSNIEDISSGISQTEWLKSIYNDSSLSGNAKLWDSSYKSIEYNSKNVFDKKLYDHLSSFEKNGLAKYTGNFYHDINNLLRFPEKFKGNPVERAKIQTLVDECESALSKSRLSEDMLLHRGIGGSDVLSKMMGASQDDLKNPEFLKSKIGSFITEDGFCSTGCSSSSAWGGVKLHIFAPQGTQGMYVNPISTYSGEDECLLQRGTTFEICKFLVGANGDVTDVMVKVVDQLRSTVAA